MPESYRDVDIANLKGPMGDVTPQALDAMHRAETAATEATEARDDVFERVDELGQITDAGVAWTVKNGGNTRAALDAWYLSEHAAFISVRDHGARGNGSADDTSAIQAALDLAESKGGGTVVFPAGTYAVTDFLAVPGNTVVMAYGATIRSIGNTGLVRNFKRGTTAPGYSGPSNITILGGRWDGNAFNPATNQGTVTAETDVFNFNHCENIHVRDAVILNTSSAHAVEFNAVRNGLIEACWLAGFVDNTSSQVRGMSEAVQVDAAYAASLPPQDMTPCHSITMRDCYVTSNGSRAGMFGRAIGSHGDADGPDGYGIEQRNIQVLNNTINGIGDTAIRGQVWLESLIQGNTVLRPGRDGIALHGRSTSGTSRVTDNRVLDNYVTGAGRYGIQINGSAANPHRRCTVDRNTVNGSAEQNILVDAVTDARVCGNIVSGGAAGSAIQISGCMRGLVQGNSVRAVPSNGIRLYSCSSTTVTGNVVNTCDGSGVTLDGTKADPGAGNVVSGNAISDASYQGVHVAASTGSVKIMDNSLRSSRGTSAAVGIATASKCICVGNAADGWNYATKFIGTGGNDIFSYAGSTSAPGNNIV